MANIDWGDLEAEFVTTLHATKVEPVPEAIVKLAQKSLDGAPSPLDPSVTVHAMQREFPTVEMAAAFAKHMKNAGKHTTPVSSLTVVIDPAREKVAVLNEDGTEKTDPESGRVIKTWGPHVNERLVAWRAGAPRGKRPGSGGAAEVAATP